MKQYRVFLCLVLGLFATLLTTTMVMSLHESSTVPVGQLNRLGESDLSAQAADLPVIITDTLGDSTGDVDVIEIAGKSTEVELLIAVKFSPGTNILLSEAGGAILLDLDQNSSTGKTAEDIWFGLPTQDVGAEILLSLYPDKVEVRDAETSNIISTLPVTQTIDSLSFAVPLGLLNNDEGQINFVAIMGDKDGPTDWAPETGYGIIAAPYVQFLPFILK